MHFYLRCLFVNILLMWLPNYVAAPSSPASNIIMHKCKPSLAWRQIKTSRHALYFLLFLRVPSTGLNYLRLLPLRHSFCTGIFLQAAYAGLRIITKRAIACCSCNYPISTTIATRLNNLLFSSLIALGIRLLAVLLSIRKALITASDPCGRS